MDFKNASIEYLVRIVAEDMGHYIEEGSGELSKSVYSILESWMSYIDDELATDDIQLLLNQFDESMSWLSIWDADPKLQQDVIGKIKKYFAEYYGSETYVNNLALKIVELYQEQLVDEFSI